MDELKNSPCEECNVGDSLHAELEHLRRHLGERDGHIVALEAEFLKCSARVNDLEEQVDTWREKYERLYVSHKRVQKLNQVLEDKLLQMVDRMKGEKSQLTKDIATLSVRLAESKHNYCMLQKENERYKNDMNLAIQLLQCKPDNFVSQKLDNLPIDTQARVSQYVMSKTPKAPSAQTKNGNEETFDSSEYEFNISASLMTKILEDSIQDSVTKHCDTCTCSKTQNKPFCYNDSYYSVSTQTHLSGEMKNSLCLNCNAEINSASNLSMRSTPVSGIKLMNDRNLGLGLTGPLYLVPQPEEQNYQNYPNDNQSFVEINSDVIKTEEIKQDIVKKDSVLKIDERKRKNSINMEPAVHHKLCDRTKTPTSSKRSITSVGHDDLKDVPKDIKVKIEKNENHTDSVTLRKDSHGSMGALSRTSSMAKSTVSTYKSNTQIGPGPRFCHLRMQAGSKNILLDNAEPDVPPVLYRRQSKCNENPIFKDLNDGMDNFIDLEPKDNDKNENVVVESTLIDVHVDSTVKEINTCVKSHINPVLMNVSSSPLQPLKTHNFNGSEKNNNQTQSDTGRQNTSEVDNLLNDFNGDVKSPVDSNVESKTDDVPRENLSIQVFNFDQYEQKLRSLPRPLKKVDMLQLHSIENTRISKDFLPPNLPKIDKKDLTKPTLPTIVNVYPNLTQTHLKVNDNKKAFTNEQSTSSLSSDDSAALLQKQQLLRVAEWVEQNLEQQNNFNDPLEDEVSFANRITRRENKLSKLTETLNELALNMPHPVSKFAKPFRDGHNNWIFNSKDARPGKVVKTNNIAKETTFSVDRDDATITEVNDNGNANKINEVEFDIEKEVKNAIASTSNGDKEITPEDLARMEYNVKKFLLSGPHWVTSETVGRNRRTSSKTETDV